MRQVKAAQQPRVQEPVVDPEMHVVPGYERQDFQHYLLPARVRIQARPAELQEAPREDHAGAEQQDRQTGLRQLAPQLSRRQGPRIERPAQAKGRQDVPRQQPRGRAKHHVDAAEKEQPRQHDLPGRQGFKSLAHEGFVSPRRMAAS